MSGGVTCTSITGSTVLHVVHVLVHVILEKSAFVVSCLAIFVDDAVVNFGD